MWQSLLLILPVLVFSFSHMAAVSQFALDVQKEKKGDVAETERHVSRIELITAVMLVVFTMFFVWSCTLTLGAEGMDAARAANVPVLSYFANQAEAQFMALITPVVTICAIASSYFGHMLGTEEGAASLVRVVAPDKAKTAFTSSFSSPPLGWRSSTRRFSTSSRSWAAFS